jgi:hypothetical protein
MSDSQLPKEEKFRDALPLSVDAMSVSVDLQIGTVDVATHSRDGKAFLFVDEARELRDWLNKVLPV